MTVCCAIFIRHVLFLVYSHKFMPIKLVIIYEHNLRNLFMAQCEAYMFIINGITRILCCTLIEIRMSYNHIHKEL